MKEFMNVLRRFVPPYKKYLVLSVVFNILSAVLNIFSFAALIPILQILFQTGEAEAATAYMAWDWGNVQNVLMNNLNYFVTQLIAEFGQTTTLLFIGIFLALTTALKTGAYFLSSATIIPIRTGVVRDIRNQLYQKITSLPLGYFSEERKGDIIARMSGDVQEVEPRHAVQEPHTDHRLLLYATLRVVATHAVHHRLCPHLRMVHGIRRP